MATFEKIKSDHQIEIGSDRSFGIVFAIVFSLFGFYPALKGADLRLWCLGVALVFLILSFVRPQMLHPLNVVWAQVGILIGKVTTPVFLGILFFGVLTPIGWILRLTGKDLIRLKKKSEATYWIERQPPGPNPESMTRQF